MKKRAKDLRGKFKMNSEKTKGTSVKISIPDTKLN